MTTSIAVDVIDQVLGLKPNSPLADLRDQRAKLKHLTQTSYVAALHPEDPRNFSYAERAAIAARMAGLWRSTELVAHYKALAQAEGAAEDVMAIAEQGWMPTDETSRMASVLRHVDLVTLTPKQATRANIEALTTAGLDDRDIVTLAGLIAFVNYQVLVVAGLKMLRDN